MCPLSTAANDCRAQVRTTYRSSRRLPWTPATLSLLSRTSSQVCPPPISHPRLATPHIGCGWRGHYALQWSRCLQARRHLHTAPPSCCATVYEPQNCADQHTRNLPHRVQQGTRPGRRQPECPWRRAQGPRDQQVGRRRAEEGMLLDGHISAPLYAVMRLRLTHIG